MKLFTSWTGFAALWVAIAALAWRIEELIHRDDGGQFRGLVRVVQPTDESARADRVAEFIRHMREGGYEPQRTDFDLPAGWSPPPSWNPPPGFVPPDWWKTTGATP